MSFQEFFDSIEHADLRHVAQHWAEARGAKRMPAWRDIDPTAMPRQLRIIWSWKYDLGTDEFSGRLAGDDIEAAFGKSFRGARMADIFSAGQYSTIHQRYRQVVLGPCLCHGIGGVFTHLDRPGIGERVIMPLAADGRNSDGLLGASIYRTSHLDDDAPVEHRETTRFFELDLPAP